MTRVMPPPKPYWDHARIAQWFSDNHTGLLVGFGIIFLVSGMVPGCNAIIAYSMRRMSVSRAFAYSYIAIYSLSAIPGMLLAAIFLSVGAMRPDRDPTLIAWLYDAGVPDVRRNAGRLPDRDARLDDRDPDRQEPGLPEVVRLPEHRQSITEIVVAPCWIMKSGAFAWNGSIAFWVDTAVFVVYTAVFITLLRKMVIREDFGNGPLPDRKRHESPQRQSSKHATRRRARPARYLGVRSLRMPRSSRATSSSTCSIACTARSCSSGRKQHLNQNFGVANTLSC